MTIKKQISISNICIILVTVIGLMLAALALRIALLLVSDYGGLDMLELFELRRHHAEGWTGGLQPFMFFTLFGVFITVISNLLALRLIKSISRPLKALSEGVRQIYDVNLSYRINYQSEDEFRQISDAFDEMAAKLEASAVERKKNEDNRRELLAGISHDLRTPLTAIKGYLEVLESDVASTPAMRETYFSIIKKKTYDLEQIIEQLFLFSRLDMNEFPITLRPVAIAQVIQGIMNEISEEYATRGLDIHLGDLPPDMIISADILHLRSAILNILENSVKYKAKERGRIDISAAWDKSVAGSAAQDIITLRFTDDGPGVSEDALDKLFDSHYRADPSRSKKGSGLGLAISSKIFEYSGGWCRAELSQNGGLAIVISIPAQQGTAA